jgi:hypothetical protein
VHQRPENTIYQSLKTLLTKKPQWLNYFVNCVPAAAEETGPVVAAADVAAAAATVAVAAATSVPVAVAVVAAASAFGSAAPSEFLSGRPPSRPRSSTEAWTSDDPTG